MWRKFLVLSVILVGVVLRTNAIYEPLGDWHSWRQADTASVAREYVKHGIDLFTPHYLDLSSIPSGLDNPSGYRMVEFPIISALHATLASHFPISRVTSFDINTLHFVTRDIYPADNVVVWGRILSILTSAMTILLLYLIVAHLSGFTPALLASLVYALYPYNIYYGRVILPEPWLVMFMLGSLYSYLKYRDNDSLIYWLIGLLSLSLAVLMKPTALVIILPIFGYLISRGKPGLRRTILTLILPLLAVIPYVLWRRHIAQFPSGIPASSWLFNGNGIRFKGAWFRWLFGERIAKNMLGYWGVPAFAAGIFALGHHKKGLWVYLGLLLGAFTYMAIIATGNVQHDYYQIQIAPVIAVFAGLGIDWLIKSSKGVGKYLTSFTLMFFMILSFALSWYELKGYFWVNNRDMVEAGHAVDQLAGPEDLVIAPYMGDTAFLFQTNRRGWPIGGDIESKIKAGAKYYVTTSKDDEFNALKLKYPVVKEISGYAIIDLTL